MSEERTPNEVDRQLGRRVRERRLLVRMSQERLANLLGVTFQQVQKYEKGVNRIAASRLVDIALALDVSAATFFDNLAPIIGKAAKQVAPDDILSTVEGAALAELFARSEFPGMRRRIVDVVRVLAADAVIDNDKADAR